jgi:hypothetical protein
MGLATDSWPLMGLVMSRFYIAFISVLWGASCFSQSTSTSTEEPLIIYKIQTGDTLSELSRKYLRQPADLEAIRSLNNLRSLDLLPTGEQLKIPRAAVKQSPSQATVINISCSREIRAGTPLRPMSIGSVLNEGAIVDIPAECHVAMLLEDSSVIRLPSSAAIRISTLRKNALESSPEVRLDLVRGRIELEVYKGRSHTTPFEVRTPLSVTGVRGTEFRVGYTPSEEIGQVEVISGIVTASGSNDTQSQKITKGQGVPFDKLGKALPIEKLLGAPVFERAEMVNRDKASYNIKLVGRPQASRYIAISANSANMLGEQTSQTLSVPEVVAFNLTQQAAFYQFASVSNSGLVGSTRQYGFCAVNGDIKAGRCRAFFEAPLAEGVMISFSLTRHAQGTTQELVSTKKLQAKNGRFSIEGLPAGHYTWSMSYATLQSSIGQQSNDARLTKQSGSFDLIAFSAQ